MNKYFLGLLIIILTFGSLNIQAQNQRTLTLEQSISIAKENSPIAMAANFQLVSAKWRYKSFRADLLPSLDLDGNVPGYSRAITANRLDDGSTVYQEESQSQSSVNLSINQNIMPTGGNLSLSSGINRLILFDGGLNGENIYRWQSTPLVATYFQPLFQYNSLKWRNKTEPLRYQIAQKQFVEDMEDLAFNVTQSFFDFLLAKINVEVAEFNVTVNDSIYNISQGRYQVGSIAENDLLQSELALRNAETSLTTANLNFQRAEENFKALLGIPDQIVVEVIIPDEAPALNIDVDKALELARENNSTSLEYELSEIQANQSYDQARKEAGFSATIQASYGLNQTSEDFSQLYDDPQNRQFFTIGFQIPIFNWGKNTAEIQAARNQQAATANTIAYQKLQFDLNVRSTVREFSQLQSQVQLAETSDEIAERRYDVAKNRYLIGNIDVTNLFIAQNEKDSARRSYIQALRNYWTGYYNLRRLTLYDFEENAPIVLDTDL
ncbi:MAG: TolC family protein [Gracilimonas sp.]|uniref:TolC family protein n=1 Tax=Gracilimonas sp. TaxID=1974203 RepID=UPI0019A4DFCF|nr:TolC family protein [Gracilimonas sp.]MBD3617486.1 TolC family protein [Gracilimonas sp.]